MKSCIFGFVLAGYFVLGLPCNADQTIEPPQKMVLQIDGRQVEIVPGEEITLTGHYSNPTARVLASPTRHFSYGGICFEYPASFGWEADVDDTYRSWTMTGNECVIIYFTFVNRITSATFAASLEEQYGPANTKVESVNRRLGSIILPGKRVIANIAGNRIVQDVLDVPVASGHSSRLLVLQDMTESDAGGPDEAKWALELLSESFRNTD